MQALAAVGEFRLKLVPDFLFIFGQCHLQECCSIIFQPPVELDDEYCATVSITSISNDLNLLGTASSFPSYLIKYETCYFVPQQNLRKCHVSSP